MKGAEGQKDKSQIVRQVDSVSFYDLVLCFLVK
jgi:hypothetical protein